MLPDPRYISSFLPQSRRTNLAIIQLPLHAVWLGCRHIDWSVPCPAQGRSEQRGSNHSNLQEASPLTSELMVTCHSIFGCEDVKRSWGEMKTIMFISTKIIRKSFSITKCKRQYENDSTWILLSRFEDFHQCGVYSE